MIASRPLSGGWPRGAYFLAHDCVAVPLPGKGRKKQTYVVVEKIIPNDSRDHCNQWAADDFGDLFQVADTYSPSSKDERPEYVILKQFARYTIGGTTYSIPATVQAVDSLRARILGKKRFFADKYTRPAVPTVEDAATTTEAQAAPDVAPMVASVAAPVGTVATPGQEATNERHAYERATQAAAYADAPYSVSAARYSKSGMMAIHTPSPDGYRTRASRLAATFGKWSHRQNGYVVTASGARRFAELYAAGWDASYMIEGAKGRQAPQDQTELARTSITSERAAQDVARVVASATAAAAIEQAQAAPAESQARELETVDCEASAGAAVCELSSASGSAAPVDSVIMGVCGPAQSAPVVGPGAASFSQFKTNSTGVSIDQGNDGPADSEPATFSQFKSKTDGTLSEFDAAIKAGYENRNPTTYARIKVGEAFSFSKDGPVFIKSRNGYRPGRGGELCKASNTWQVYFHDPAYAMADAEHRAAGLRSHKDWPTAEAVPGVCTPEQAQPVPCPEPLSSGQLESKAGEPTGQKIAGKSGNWRAVFYTRADGLPCLRFYGGMWEDMERAYQTGSERMKALQALAQCQDIASAAKAEYMATAQAAAAGVSATTPAATAPGAPVTSSGQLETKTPEAPAEDAAGPGALSITITRVEGLASECWQPVTVGSFSEADALLMTWSATAPATGGYDKCHFSIVWPDGGTYTGRYDLKHHSCEPASLSAHMIDLAEYHTGRFCPLHLSASAYKMRMNETSDETRSAYAEVLATMASLGAYFPKVRPVALDLRAIVAAGAAPAALVGLGVVYCGSRCNHGGRGAIVATGECEYYGLVVDVILEDGSEHNRVRASDFDDNTGSRYRLDGKVHGAPYLAQLAGAVATVKAQASAAKAQQAAAHAQALIDTAATYPQLQRQGGKLHGVVLAAANLRVLLKATFPGVKFSVRTSKYSGGDNMRIEWTDGPNDAAVEAIVDQFSGGSFDGRDDSYTYSRSAFTELFGSAKYTSAVRNVSQALVAKALAQLYPDEATRPSVDDWNHARGVFDFSHYNDHEQRMMRECLASLTN